jgi:hypothetical protein
MPTFQELERAFVNADKAGDKETAAILARELRYQVGLSRGAEQEKKKVEEPKPVQATEPSESSSDLIRGFTNYLPQLQETYGGAKVLAGKVFGSEDLMKSGLTTMAAAKAELATKHKASDSFTSALDKGVGTVLTDWLPYQIGSGAANLVESLGVMFAGGALGSLAAPGIGTLGGGATALVEKELVKRGIKELAEKIAKESGEEAAKELFERETKAVVKDIAKRYAAGTALAAQAGFHGAGETTSRAVEEAQRLGKEATDIELERVLPAAIVHGVAEYFGDKIGLGAWKNINDDAKTGMLNLAGSLLKNTAVTGTKEAPVEVIQSAAERFGAKLSLTDAQAVKEYIDSAAAAYGMAVTPAAGGTVRGYANAMAKEDARLAEEQIKVQQSSQKADEEAAKIDQTAVVDPQGNVSPVSFAPIQQGSVDAAPAADAQLDALTATTTAASAATTPVVDNDTIKAAYAANDVSTEKARKALEPQLVAMGLDTKEKQKEFLNAKRDELGIPAFTPGAKGVEAVKAKQAKTQWKTNYETEQLLKREEPSGGQLNEADLARDQSGAIGTPSESGVPPGGATTSIDPRLDDSRGDAQPTITTTPIQPTTLKDFKKMSDQELANIYSDYTGADEDTAAAKAELINRGKYAPIRTVELEQILNNSNLPPEQRTGYEAELNELKKGAPSVTETTEAVKAEEKRQEKESAPPVNPEVLRAAYTEQVKIASESGLKFPAWEELSEAERAALAEEVQATRGMLPSKGGQKVGFLSPAMASIIKSRIDKKIESGEIDLTRAHPEVTDLYEEARQDWGDRNGVRTVAWDGLSTDEKAIYLNNIGVSTPSSKNEVYNALDILTDYREAKAPRGASFYENNREAYNKDMPEWASLHNDEREAFLKAIEPGLGAKTAKPKVTTEQMDTGFKAVVEKYNERTKRRAERQTEISKGRDEQAQQKREEKQRQESEQVDTGYRLPKSVILQLFKGDIKGVLQYLSQNAKGMAYAVEKITGKRLDEKLNNFRAGQAAISRGVFRQLSKALGTVSYDTKVVMEESNSVVKQLRREGKLAAYDPKTDTLYFTNDGLDEQTVLHEITHAGTVKILYKYKTDPSSLTQEQREAAEHIEKIYEFAKPRLGGRHKFAFENVYEFVSYAMTDVGLQRDLANVQARGLGKYTTENKPFLRSILSRFGSLWGQFTQALMKMYGLTKAGRTFTPSENIPDDIVKGFNELPQDELQGPRRKGVIYQRPASERVSKEAIARGSAQAGYEANLLVEMSEAFGRILAAPEAGIDIEALPAKKPAKPPIQAPAEGTADFKAMRNAMPQYNTNPARELSRMSKAKLGETAVRTFQNDRAAIKNWENKLRFAGRLVAYTAGFNNIYTQLTLSSGNAHYLFTQYIQNHSDAIRTGVAEYAKKRGLSIDDAVNELGLFAIALHEPERRRTLYIRDVPLEQNLATLKDAKGNSITPFEAREAILKYLDKNYLDESGAKYLRNQLDKIVDDKNNLSKEESDKLNLDIDSQKYNVAGFSPEQIKAAKAEYNKNKADADVIFKEIKELNKSVIALNEKSNYLSKYAKNYFMFYGYENYVPFKGKNFNEDKADIFNTDSRKLGGELQDQIHTFEGRLTVPDNPILQVMADGAQAAMRAGRKDVTQAIYNAVKDKTLQGSIMKFKDAGGKERDYISFEDRADDNVLAQLKGETKVFHYMPDGKVAVIQIDDKQQREAIRRSYRETNPLLDSIVSMGNLLTGTLGQLHTRYNVAFAPVNFVRDVLTNAFTLGAELGPKETFRYIGAVASGVAQGGMLKTTNFARLYSQGKTSTLEALANSDKTGYYRDLLDYIKTGGKVSYIAGIAPKGQYQEFFKGVGGNKILNKKEEIDKYFDMWIDTFELSARVASYRVTKANEIARLTKKDPTKSKAEIEEAATVTASAYAKNLANFEQVGQWGKALGAFFMFFRPSATGAVRAIDAIAPALNMNIERAVISTPEYARAANIREQLSKGVSAAKEKELKAELAEMDEAVATFRENYSKAKTSARVMSIALVGMGMAAYAMSYMMADDDEQGRNKTATDDMSRWTRFARFPIPGTEIIVQIPWGFGLGGMAAMGAQMASMFNGNTRALDIAANMFVVGMDSFLPLPVSRISPVEKPLPFLIDSMMPSFARPLVEYTMNVDALGRKIYNDRTSRLGDAYTGGDNIPEIYKDTAIWWLKFSGYDVSPNTLYFFANNYADGVTRLVQNANNVRLWMSDKKDFNPKTDLMILDSFFGTKSNFDSREWSRVEADLEERSKYVKMLKDNHPADYAVYMSKHPMDQMLAKMYNHDVNGRLKDLREQANKWRDMEGLDPRTRTALVKNIVFQQNIEKRRLINLYRAYGVEP